MFLKTSWAECGAVTGVKTRSTWWWVWVCGDRCGLSFSLGFGLRFGSWPWVSDRVSGCGFPVAVGFRFEICEYFPVLIVLCRLLITIYDSESKIMARSLSSMLLKGIAALPATRPSRICGFSSLAVRVLKQYNVPLASRNILEDPELKSAVKTFSHWAQQFHRYSVKGEFIGGSDIILNLHQSGELKEKLKDRYH
ncbi:hypothetical protein RGQ29_032007 [Quercus rubra]|uniref:Glutaredoxin domain-containing protein n=1 Tax=Quercus rubra TaxID=3512 RepID=A0AAN7I5C9_QUERU|nr:hypothetical protein RGQ29_032007 [Quercus rubra]